jgi:hypothetical protein
MDLRPSTFKLGPTYYICMIGLSRFTLSAITDEGTLLVGNTVHLPEAELPCESAPLVDAQRHVLLCILAMDDQRFLQLQIVP